MRIALAQLTSTTDPAANLDLVSAYCARAKSAGAELVIFPEATMCSFRRDSSEVAEELTGPWATAIHRLAAKLDLTIVLGTFCTGTGPLVRNTLLVAGETSAHYDKLHLFDALGFQESRKIEPGDQLGIVEIGGIRFGLAICYDIRFPELFAALARSGAEAIIVAASWAPGPNKAQQWRTLATARAMDSTSFLIAVDQAATGDVEAAGKPTGVGNSMVIDPLGNRLLVLGSDPELALIDLDVDGIFEARQQLPLLAHQPFPWDR